MSNVLVKYFLLGVKKTKKYTANRFIRTKGGGVAKLYRRVDFNFLLGISLPYLFLGYVHDPRRTAFLSLYVYFNGIVELRIGSQHETIFDLYVPYKLDLSENQKAGQIIMLNCIGGGKSLHNLPFQFKSNAKMIRSAGMFCQILRHDLVAGLSYIRVRKGFDVVLPSTTLVIIGRVCNKMHFEFKKGKAGILRRIGVKPIVRGIAMNPVDHPNGGRTPGGKVYRSFSNKIARSFLKTNTRNFRRNKFISLVKRL